MTPEKGAGALFALRARDGRPTIVTLATGQSCRVLNIVWGRDEGAEFDHITTNVSPTIDGMPVDHFVTSEICRLEDERGAVLFENEPENSN